MARVVIESPYKGDTGKNELYLRECMRDCFDRNEAPFASHRLYTSALDDNKPVQRMLGITAGLEWGECADKIIVYYDRGISDGMKLGIKHYTNIGKKIEFRSLYER
jgi:hypothetical protein